MELLVILLIGLAVIGLVSARRQQQRRQRLEDRKAADLAAVKRTADEDVTRYGEEVTRLDTVVIGHDLDDAGRQDYQRALDCYEQAKAAVDAVREPDQVKHVTEILEDGRYAMACVRARVVGEPLPQRRPPCFFDPRHGMSVADVPWTPPGGARREVPACALDVERVRAGAEPDIRKVMVGSRRVPYWQGGRAYQPYAQGYFGAFSPMDWMFMGMLFGGGFDGLGEGIGAIGEGIGDMFGGIGDGIGGMFDGFDGFDF